jgi:hypothetical protein
MYNDHEKILNRVLFGSVSNNPPLYKKKIIHLLFNKFNNFYRCIYFMDPIPRSNQGYFLSYITSKS